MISEHYQVMSKKPDCFVLWFENNNSVASPRKSFAPKDQFISDYWRV